MEHKTVIKICSPQLGLSPNSILGGEVYDYQTIKGFCLQGFKVFIYLPKNRLYDKKLKNLKVSFCFMTHIVPPWIYSFLMLPYLFKLYQKERFDILRIHSPRFLGFGAFIFHLIYPQVKILSSAVTVDSAGFFYFIERWVYQNSDAIIVQSQYMKSVLKNKYKILDDKKIHVTLGGQMDQPKIYHHKPAESKIVKPTDKVLLFMGALIERKNPQFALGVFIEIKKLFPSSKMVFIGQGDQKSILAELASRAELKQDVIFIDRTLGEEKAYWFIRMDLFLFPSLDEGFGLVVTEAMSFKKVVIASNKAAFPEIIENGKDGFSLKLDKKLWVDSVVRILENPKLSARIGSQAEKKVKQQFNWDRTYKLNAGVIRNMI